MELLLNPKKYKDNILTEGLSQSEIDEIKNSLEFDGEKEISEKNIGTGADVFVIFASILTIVNVFMLGDKIDKGIDGWISIGRRIKKMFNKRELVAVDKDGASLLAIEFISEIEPIKTLEKANEHEINLVRVDSMFIDGRKPDELISKPFNYFIQTYLINNEKLYVVGIKSTGEADLIKCFEFGNPYGIKEIKTTP